MHTLQIATLLVILMRLLTIALNPPVIVNENWAPSNCLVVFRHSCDGVLDSNLPRSQVYWFFQIFARYISIIVQDIGLDCSWTSWSSWIIIFGV